MAKSDEYPVLVGKVQKFGDKPAVMEREIEVDGEDVTVREFTVKAAGTQKLVKVTLWPEFDHVEIGAGDLVGVEGKFSSNQGKTATFYNLSANDIAVTPSAKRKKTSTRATASQTAEDPTEDEDPPF